MIRYQCIKKIILLSIAGLLTISSSFAANESTDPGLMSAPTPMVLCPQVKINSSTLNSSQQDVSFGGPVFSEDVNAGSTDIIMFTGGGTVGLQCPNDHPYLMGLNESWHGWGGGTIFPFPIFVFWLDQAFTFRCTTTPEPQMSIQQGYSPSYNTWYQGTKCP